MSIHHLLFSPFSLQWFSPRADRIIPFGFEPVFSIKNKILGFLWLAASVIRTDSLEDIFLKLRKQFWAENKVLTGHLKKKAILRSSACCSFNQKSFLACLLEPQPSLELMVAGVMHCCLYRFLPDVEIAASKWTQLCPPAFGQARVNGGPSQSHRVVWVGRDLKDHLVPTPLPRAATSSTRPGCSELHPTRP